MRGSLPDLPRGARTRPELLQVLAVPQRVHGLPEAGMQVRRKLALARELLHRLALPDRFVALDVVHDLWREHEEAAVDPGAIAARLLLEARDPVPVDRERAEAPRGLGGGEGRERALLLVEADGRPD